MDSTFVQQVISYLNENSGRPTTEQDIFDYLQTSGYPITSIEDLKENLKVMNQKGLIYPHSGYWYPTYHSTVWGASDASARGWYPERHYNKVYQNYAKVVKPGRKARLSYVDAWVKELAKYYDHFKKNHPEYNDLFKWLDSSKANFNEFIIDTMAVFLHMDMSHSNIKYENETIQYEIPEIMVAIEHAMNESAQRLAKGIPEFNKKIVDTDTYRKAYDRISTISDEITSKFILEVIGPSKLGTVISEDRVRKYIDKTITKELPVGVPKDLFYSTLSNKLSYLSGNKENGVFLYNTPPGDIIVNMKNIISTQDNVVDIWNNFYETGALALSKMKTVASTIWSNMNLSGKDLGEKGGKGLDLSEITIADSNFDNSNLEGCNVSGSTIQNCSFKNASFANAIFKPSLFTGNNIEKMDLEGAIVKKSIEWEANMGNPINIVTRDMSYDKQDLKAVLQSPRVYSNAFPLSDEDEEDAFNLVYALKAYMDNFEVLSNKKESFDKLSWQIQLGYHHKETDRKGNTYYYNENNRLHKENGPAIEYSDGDKEWWIKGELHRLDDAAIEYADGSKQWWINHRFIGSSYEGFTEDDFENYKREYSITSSLKFTGALEGDIVVGLQKWLEDPSAVPSFIDSLDNPMKWFISENKKGELVDSGFNKKDINTLFGRLSNLVNKPKKSPAEQAKEKHQQISQEFVNAYGGKDNIPKEALLGVLKNKDSILYDWIVGMPTRVYFKDIIHIYASLVAALKQMHVAKGVENVTRKFQSLPHSTYITDLSRTKEQGVHGEGSQFGVAMTPTYALMPPAIADDISRALSLGSTHLHGAIAFSRIVPMIRTEIRNNIRKPEIKKVWVISEMQSDPYQKIGEGGDERASVHSPKYKDEKKLDKAMINIRKYMRHWPENLLNSIIELAQQHDVSEIWMPKAEDVGGGGYESEIWSKYYDRPAKTFGGKLQNVGVEVLLDPPDSGGGKSSMFYVISLKKEGKEASLKFSWMKQPEVLEYQGMIDKILEWYDNTDIEKAFEDTIEIFHNVLGVHGFGISEPIDESLEDFDLEELKHWYEIAVTQLAEVKPFKDWKGDSLKFSWHVPTNPREIAKFLSAPEGWKIKYFVNKATRSIIFYPKHDFDANEDYIPVNKREKQQLEANIVVQLDALDVKDYTMKVDDSYPDAIRIYLPLIRQQIKTPWKDIIEELKSKGYDKYLGRSDSTQRGYSVVVFITKDSRSPELQQIVDIIRNMSGVNPRITTMHRGRGVRINVSLPEVEASLKFSWEVQPEETSREHIRPVVRLMRIVYDLVYKMVYGGDYGGEVTREKLDLLLGYHLSDVEWEKVVKYEEELFENMEEEENFSSLKFSDLEDYPWDAIKRNLKHHIKWVIENNKEKFPAIVEFVTDEMIAQFAYKTFFDEYNIPGMWKGDPEFISEIKRIVEQEYGYKLYAPPYIDWLYWMQKAWEDVNYFIRNQRNIISPDMNVSDQELARDWLKLWQEEKQVSLDIQRAAWYNSLFLKNIQKMFQDKGLGDVLGTDYQPPQPSEERTEQLIDPDTGVNPDVGDELVDPEGETVKGEDIWEGTGFKQPSEEEEQEPQEAPAMSMDELLDALSDALDAGDMEKADIIKKQLDTLQSKSSLKFSWGLPTIKPTRINPGGLTHDILLYLSSQEDNIARRVDIFRVVNIHDYHYFQYVLDKGFIERIDRGMYKLTYKGEEALNHLEEKEKESSLKFSWQIQSEGVIQLTPERVFDVYLTSTESLASDIRDLDTATRDILSVYLYHDRQEGIIGLQNEVSIYSSEDMSDVVAEKFFTIINFINKYNSDAFALKMLSGAFKAIHEPIEDMEWNLILPSDEKISSLVFNCNEGLKLAWKIQPEEITPAVNPNVVLRQLQNISDTEMANDLTRSMGYEKYNYVYPITKDEYIYIRDTLMDSNISPDTYKSYYIAERELLGGIVYDLIGADSEDIIDTVEAAIPIDRISDIPGLSRYSNLKFEKVQNVAKYNIIENNRLELCKD